MAKATAVIPGPQVAERIGAAVPEAVEDVTDAWVQLRAHKLVDVCRFLRDDRAVDARYLNSVTGIDKYDCFEIAYNLTSLSHNHTLTLKVRADHEQPNVPSVVSIWYGAPLQEREIYDLLGIRFSGHPALTRIFLWEGFPGHPLRKDFLQVAGHHPGLPGFPFEQPGVQAR